MKEFSIVPRNRMSFFDDGQLHIIFEGVSFSASFLPESGNFWFYLNFKALSNVSIIQKSGIAPQYNYFEEDVLHNVFYEGGFFYLNFLSPVWNFLFISIYGLKILYYEKEYNIRVFRYFILQNI